MGLLSFIVTLLLFASMEVVSKPLMGSVDPLVLTLWRFICGILVLGCLLAFQRKKVRLGHSSVIMLAVMGILNTFLSMSLLQLAVKNTSAARAATVFCSNPVFVVLFASLLKWETLTRKRVLGLLLGVAGLIIVTGMHTLTIDTGTIYALLASISFALYILVSRKASLKIDPVTVNVVSFGFGIAALAVYLLIKGVDVSPAPLFKELPSFLLLGIGVSGLGYITFIRTIRRIGAGNASTIFLLKPAVATVLAILILGETITFQFGTGLVLTGLGSYLVAGK